MLKNMINKILSVGKPGSIESISGDTVPEQREWRYCSISSSYPCQWRDWSVGCCMASMAEHWCREHHSSWWNCWCCRWTVHPFTAVPYCPSSDISCSLSAHKNKVCPIIPWLLSGLFCNNMGPTIYGIFPKQHCSSICIYSLKHVTYIYNRIWHHLSQPLLATSWRCAERGVILSRRTCVVNEKILSACYCYSSLVWVLTKILMWESFKQHLHDESHLIHFILVSDMTVQAVCGELTML